ncbi:MFS transporter [Rhodoferax sp.]|jgi:MFS family permease|uniref:MFS transporter n=1 Tax=Rhodoferax sp. TaxID=50421 RepID=UPI0037842341
MPDSADPHRLTPLERRSSASLATISSLRLLGLFLVLPVFSLEVAHLPGGDNPAWVGLALGIFGLTQGLFQIPFGLASDRFGRKRLITLGLGLFTAGSVLAAFAPSVGWMVLARALQGSGAVSAAATALLADQTRDVVRTQAMSWVGGSIGLVFAVSVGVAPLLANAVGLSGVFLVTGALAAMGVVLLHLWVPPEPVRDAGLQRGRLRDVLDSPELLRLNFGVFLLHAVQVAMWTAIPSMLVQAGLPKAQHWWVYLPVVGLSFVLMGMTLFPMERRGRLRAIFLLAVGLIALVEVALAGVVAARPSVLLLSLLMFVFFYGFNVLEASMPSMASRLSPKNIRGASLGVYNTLQSFGFFAGGLVGGALFEPGGSPWLFGVCALGMLAWLVVAWPMVAPGRPPRASPAKPG